MASGKWMTITSDKCKRLLSLGLPAQSLWMPELEEVLITVSHMARRGILHKEGWRITCLAQLPGPQECLLHGVCMELAKGLTGGASRHLRRSH